MSDHSRFWRTAMDHPYVVGAAIGVVAGIAAVAVSAVVTSVVTNIATRVGGQATTRIIAENAPRFTKHASERIMERNVSKEAIVETIKKGTKYFDPKYGTKMSYYKDIAVAQAKSGKITTVMNKVMKAKARWIKL